MSETLDKFLEALRSGEYDQARGALRQERRFCCLGVACDVYRKETGLGEWHAGDDGSYYFVGPGGVDDVSVGIMPRSVQQWLGLPDGNPEIGVTPDEATLSCAGANDAGTPFGAIADLIEQTYGREETE